MSHTITAQIQEVDRELALRRSVYSGMVARKKMRQSIADEHMARMESVLKTLRFVDLHVDEFHAWVAERRDRKP